MPMLDLTKLTQEERDVFAQFVRTPGWTLLMRQAIIPQIVQSTEQLGQVGISEAHANSHRGLRHWLLSFVTTVYRAARVPDPFERNALALMNDLDFYARTLDTQVEEDTRIDTTSAGTSLNDTPPLRGRPTRRVSFPV